MKTQSFSIAMIMSSVLLLACGKAASQTWEQIEEQHLRDFQDMDKAARDFMDKHGVNRRTFGRITYDPDGDGLKWEPRTYTIWDLVKLEKDTVKLYDTSGSKLNSVLNRSAMAVKSKLNTQTPRTSLWSPTESTSGGFWNTVSSWFTDSTPDSAQGAAAETASQPRQESYASSPAGNEPMVDVKAEVTSNTTRDLGNRSAPDKNGLKVFDASKLDAYWEKKVSGMEIPGRSYNPSDEISGINNTQAEQTRVAALSAKQSAENQARTKELIPKLEDLRVKIGETKVRIESLQGQAAKIRTAISSIDKRIKEITRITQEMQSSLERERLDVQNQINAANQEASQEQMQLLAEKQRLQNQLSSIESSIQVEQARAQSYESDGSDLLNSLALAGGMALLGGALSGSSTPAAVSENSGGATSGWRDPSSSTSMQGAESFSGGGTSVQSHAAMPSVGASYQGPTAADMQKLQGSYNPWGKISQYRTRGLTDAEQSVMSQQRKLF